MENRVEGPASGRLVRLCRHLVAVQEGRYRSIGAALHGDLGQMLTALKLILSTPGLADGEGEAGATLAEARQLTSELLERVRDMALQLRPAMLDDLGLQDTLDWYLQSMARQGELSLDFRTRGLDRRPGAELETACFRSIQESVDNVVRHARARSLTVRVALDPDELAFEVIDDGEGFEVEKVRKRPRPGSGLGLDAMEARLMLLGGGLKVDSRPGHGTRVQGNVTENQRRSPEGGAQ